MGGNAGEPLGGQVTLRIWLEPQYLILGDKEIQIGGQSQQVGDLPDKPLVRRGDHGNGVAVLLQRAQGGGQARSFRDPGLLYDLQCQAEMLLRQLFHIQIPACTSAQFLPAHPD